MIASSSSTYVVDKLERKKLLIRKPCSKDGRITNVALTSIGKNLMNRVFPKHKLGIKDIFSA
ncbi:hypothetical protein J6TS2_05180 [Heyndrickxia sporothermodurans]|nr:hypothetical protein J6TS2_05180 [Heyndrickxia sporothermodurans]